MKCRWVAFVERGDDIVVPIMDEEDEGLILIFQDRKAAQSYLESVPLYQAFGGYVVNLDEAAE